MQNFLIWNSDVIILEKDESPIVVFNLEEDEAVYCSFSASAKAMISLLRGNISKLDFLKLCLNHYSAHNTAEEVNRALELFLRVLIEKKYLSISQKKPSASHTEASASVFLKDETHLNLNIEFTMLPEFDVAACAAQGEYCDTNTPCCAAHSCFMLNEPPLYPGTCRRMGGGGT